tara:strand:- start:697 stop:891 length:195 start_codon:yes stop_codon:yes gene_type:complete
MNDFFNWCVWLLEVTAPMVGMTYQEINIWLFVIIQPALIVLFFVLWIRAINKPTHNQHSKQIEV